MEKLPPRMPLGRSCFQGRDRSWPSPSSSFLPGQGAEFLVLPLFMLILCDDQKFSQSPLFLDRTHLLVLRINSDPGHGSWEALPRPLLLPVVPRTGNHAHHSRTPDEELCESQKNPDPPGHLHKMQMPRPSVPAGSGSPG